MNDEIKQKRLQQIEELIGGFPTEPVYKAGSCPECKNGLHERDKVVSGGSVYYVTTLYYCTHCGYHRIGEEYWTTNDY